MTTGERAQAIIHEFATSYFFVVQDEDGENRVCMSSAKFARTCLPLLESAINQAEHHEKQQEIREAREEANRDDHHQGPREED